MKHTIVLLCGLVAVVSTGYIENYQKTDDGREYFIEFEQKYNWYEALYACARKNMSLISMDTRDTSEQFKKLFKKISANTEPWLWLAGSSNAGDNRHYDWLTTGQSFAYTNWASGSPSDVEEDNCVAIWSKEADWNNVPCTLRIGYICEEMPLVKRKNQELLSLKASYELQLNSLRSKVVEEMTKSCEDEKIKITTKEAHEKEIQALKDKPNESTNQGSDTETQVNQLMREKNEMEKKLSDCLKSQTFNGTSVTNKYYNVIVNVTANAQQLKLMANP